jgi:hypothetical protein
MWAELYPWVVAGVGGAIGSVLTALLLLVPKFGEMFFKARIDRALEAYKAEKNRDIEGLRERLNHIADRGRRSNENEFNALRSIWEKFIVAYYSTYGAVISFIQFPPLNTMTDDRITEFLASNEFDGSTVRDILASKDREQSFSRAYAWRQINQAGKDNFECIQELRRQRVFISEDIRRQFSSALEICTGAQAQRQVDHAMPRSVGSGMFINNFLTNGDAAVDALATAVNKRLFRDEARSS